MVLLSLHWSLHAITGLQQGRQKKSRQRKFVGDLVKSVPAVIATAVTNNPDLA